MTRRGRTCVAPGCERRAAIGSVVCNEHKETALGEQTDREILKMTQRLAEMAKFEKSEEQRDAAQTFRRQVARGDYAALFSTNMVDALNEEGEGYGLRQEIGMMRVGMMRLLLEEESPSKMAHALAKLSFALGKSQQIQEGWDAAAAQRKKATTFMTKYRGEASEGGNAFLDMVEGMAQVDAEMHGGLERPTFVRSPELEPNGFKPAEWERVGMVEEDDGVGENRGIGRERGT